MSSGFSPLSTRPSRIISSSPFRPVSTIIFRVAVDIRVPGDSVFANSYIFGNVLVDAGVMPMAVAPYKEAIETIVLSHCHFDHTARVKEIAHMCRAKVAIHRDDVRGLVEDAHSLSMHFGARSPGIVPDIILTDGDTVGDLLVLHTPGHTPGSICLYSERDKVLISGDTVFADGFSEDMTSRAGAERNFPVRLTGSRSLMSKACTRAMANRPIKEAAAA